MNIKQVFALLFCLSMVLTSVSFSGEDGAVECGLSWRTDVPVSVKVEYGESGKPLSAVSPGSLSREHSVTLSGLRPDTWYDYRVVSIDEKGNTSAGPLMSFLSPTTGGSASVPVISDVRAQGIVAAGPAVVGDSPVNVPVTAPPAAKMIKTEPVIAKPLIDKGGILLKKGVLQVEPSVSYAHISANRIAINGVTILPMLIIGEIATEQVKRDIWIASLTSRYGLLDNLQVELRVPYRFEFDRQSNSSFSTERTVEHSGIGDIDGTVMTQLFYETAAMPDIIAGLNVKSRTGKSPYGSEIGLGTGHWSVKGSLMAVKTADPAIVFGGIGYAYSFERDVDGFGEAQPGPAYSYNIGFAFALNYQFGLNFQFENTITESLTMNGRRVPGSFTNAANFKSGASWSYSKDLAVNINVAIGLTSDSPDFTFEVKLPYTF